MNPTPTDPTANFLQSPTRFKAAGIGDVTLQTGPDSRAGGMGCVYFDGGNAFKIYHDRQQAEKDKLPERLGLLAKINHEQIIGPRGLIHDLKGNFAGYWMPTVQGGEELSRLLTLQYQTSQGLGIRELVQFLEKRREIKLFAHSKGAVIGDPNERNTIVRKVPRKGLTPYELDVDNWGIVNKFGPVAVAPHVQDHQHRGPLTQLTDDYGMGIVFFWLLSCTHPYGGRLQGIDHRDPEHLIKRMKAQASIFRSGVKYPPATRALNELPRSFVEWCGRTFEHGERTELPSLLATAPTAQAAVTLLATAGGPWHTKLLAVTNDAILRIFGCGLALTRSGKLLEIEGGKEVAKVKSPACQVVKTGNHYLIGDYKDDGSPLFFCVEAGSGKLLQIEHQFAGERVWVRDNRMYLIAENSISELKLWAMGGTPILTAAQTWPIVGNTMVWLDECAVQSIFGKAHIWVPHTEGSYTVLPVPELDGLTPVAARAGGWFAFITAQGRGGKSFRVEIKFSRNFSSVEVNKVATPHLQLNLTVVDGSFAAEIAEDDSGDAKLEMFAPFASGGKSLQDGHIHIGMQISSVGKKLLYLLNGAVWHLKPSLEQN